MKVGIPVKESKLVIRLCHLNFTIFDQLIMHSLRTQRENVLPNIVNLLLIGEMKLHRL